VLEHDTAGDPITGLRWTHRTPAKIAHLLQQFDIQVCTNTVARLLESMDYSLRVNHKTLATGASVERNQQFEVISALRTGFERRALPMISVDTKKRELVGNFKNPGAKWDRSPVQVNDHDFRSDAIGVAIPYGIYDLLANCGSIFVGISHDTAAFAAHCIARWWQREGLVRYRRARHLLILADSGGSNGCRCHAWKTELQSRLCNRFGLTVTVAHYPTGASKWNPIEHRLFSEVSKNWAAEPLNSYQKILNFIRGTRTQTGLAVTAHLDRTHYPTGNAPDPEEVRQLGLLSHPTLPRWNYTISPTL
jgi:Rhodopirellula transposase DDE domain